MLDLLVMGAGLSGLSAAYTAAQAGLRVRVVAKGLGSMHWSAGTIDLLGYLPGEEEPVDEPLTALTHLPDAHPYRQLGATRIRSALAAFQAMTESAGLDYRAHPQSADGEERNWLLPSPAGAVRPVLLAPAAQVAGDLRRDEPILLVGFEGLRDFFPELIAENLRRQGHTVRTHFLPLELITDRHDANTVQLAYGLEAPTVRHGLGTALRQVVWPGERIGLPAILGVDEHHAVMAELSDATSAPLFEIPTLPPSVPGVRLHKALRAQLLKLGVRVEAGMEVQEFGASDERLEWVATATSSRPLKHRAAHFLLATGGILGGGFTSDHTGRVWEVALQLPLTVPQDRRAWFRPGFFDPQGQPVFNGGVAVDDAFQPVDGRGRRVYANVWAAGGLLAHADPILERSLEGMAIVTGIAAAHAIIGTEIPVAAHW